MYSHKPNVGKAITVIVSYTDDQGTAETPPTSTATAAVTNTNDAGVITVTGTVTQGDRP